MNINNWDYDTICEWLGCDDDYTDQDGDLRNTDYITGCEPENDGK